MSLRSVSILRCRTLVMALLAAAQIAWGVHGSTFAQPLPAEPLPPELQAVVKKAIEDADKKRIETFKRAMETAIKKEKDPGLKQRLECERDATIQEWSPPPAAQVPVPVPQPADAALLADLRKILGTKQIKVNGGVVTLVYDFKLQDAQRVAAKDFDLPQGVAFKPAEGMQVQAQTEVKLRATFRRLKNVKTVLRHTNWEGEWVQVGDQFKASGSFTGGWKAWVTDCEAFTVFAVA